MRVGVGRTSPPGAPVAFKLHCVQVAAAVPDCDMETRAIAASERSAQQPLRDAQVSSFTAALFAETPMVLPVPLTWDIPPESQAGGTWAQVCPTGSRLTAFSVHPASRALQELEEEREAKSRGWGGTSNTEHQTQAAEVTC